MFTVIFSHPVGTEKRENYLMSCTVLQILVTAAHTNFRSCRGRSSLVKPTILVEIAACCSYPELSCTHLCWLVGKGGRMCVDLRAESTRDVDRIFLRYAWTGIKVHVFCYFASIWASTLEQNKQIWLHVFSFLSVVSSWPHCKAEF